MACVVAASLSPSVVEPAVRDDTATVVWADLDEAMLAANCTDSAVRFPRLLISLQDGI